MGIDFTHLFAPTFLVEYHGGYSRNRAHENCVWGGTDVAGQLGLNGSTHDPDLIGFPRFVVTDYAAVGCAANEPVQFHVSDIQTGFKFTWVKARHVMKWSFEHSRVRFNQPPISCRRISSTPAAAG